MDDQYPHHLTRDMYQNSQEVLHVLEGNTPESPHEKKKRQAPLGTIGFLLIAVSVGLAGGYYLVNHGADLPQLSQEATTPLPTPSERKITWKTHTDPSSPLAFSYPDTWQYEQIPGDTFSQILFYPAEMNKNESTLPVAEIYVASQAFSQRELSLSQKDKKTGAFVSNIKTVSYGGVSGYSYNPQLCTKKICAKSEVMVPFVGGEKTLIISNYTSETKLFEQFLTTLKITK